MLSRGEEVSSAGLSGGKVAVSYQTGLLRWVRWHHYMLNMWNTIFNIITNITLFKIIMRIWRTLKEGEVCQDSREAGGPAVALQIQVIMIMTIMMMLGRGRGNKSSQIPGNPRIFWRVCYSALSAPQRDHLSHLEKVILPHKSEPRNKSLNYIRFPPLAWCW